MQDRTPRPENLEPIERVGVDELRALQPDRLRWSLRHAYDDVPHHRRAFEATRAGRALVEQVNIIGVSVAVEVIESAGVERSVGKRRIVDQRRAG